MRKKILGLAYWRAHSLKCQAQFSSPHSPLPHGEPWRAWAVGKPSLLGRWCVSALPNMPINAHYAHLQRSELLVFGAVRNFGRLLGRHPHPENRPRETSGGFGAHSPRQKPQIPLHKGNFQCAIGKLRAFRRRSGRWGTPRSFASLYAHSAFYAPRNPKRILSCLQHLKSALF